jgi:hypothetical protein
MRALGFVVSRVFGEATAGSTLNSEIASKQTAASRRDLAGPPPGLTSQSATKSNNGGRPMDAARRLIRICAQATSIVQ